VVSDSTGSCFFVAGMNCSRRDLKRGVNCSSWTASENNFRGLAAVFRAYCILILVESQKFCGIVPSEPECPVNVDTFIVHNVPEDLFD